VAKYKSFEEYIGDVYSNKILDNLISFLKTKNKEDNVDFYIKKINIKKIIYTKSRCDNLEFIVYFNANYEIIYTSFFPPSFKNETKNFCIKMGGSFDKGFRIIKKGISICDILIDEKFTNGLVPVIYNEDLDKYATKFLQEYCPKALQEPMKLDVIKILKQKGIMCHFAPLEEDILGKIYFAEDKVNIYKNELKDMDSFYTIVKPGTILIDFEKAIGRGIGSVNNTLIHEAVHWFFHRNYFELRRFLDNDKKCMVCYRTEKYKYYNNDIMWMEMQARKLAPRILMPKKTAHLKLLEIIDDTKKEAVQKKWSSVKMLESIVQRFAKFFGVSLQSAKIRIKDFGYTQFDGVCNYKTDGSSLEKFSLPANLLLKNQTFIIDPEDFQKMLLNDYLIKKEIEEKRLVYTNHMIVANNSRYVKNGKLTQYALEHPEECCLIFTIQPNLNFNKLEENKIICLSNSVKNKNKIIKVEQNQCKKVLSLVDINFNHYKKHKKEIPDDLGGTIKYHYDKCKENGIFNSFEDFAYESDVSEKSIRQYINGKEPKNRTIVLKLGLAMKLSTPYLLDLLNKYDDNKRNINKENILFNTIIYKYGERRNSLEDVYSNLKKQNNEELLDVSDDWLKDHGFK
jgi:hypothetical protein